MKIPTIEKLRDLVPSYINRTADILISNGFEAYLVGGAIRDILLERTPKDYDLATNALPAQIEDLFPKTVNTNAKFGTILVIMSDDAGESFDVEVTTYRHEEEYIKGRWPSKVEFTSSIEDDLSRRDLTINALALNLQDLYESSAIVDEVILDPFNGLKDLEDMVIRAVRDPKERFTEDGLRAFKSCRMASELGFEMHTDTFNAIKDSLVIARQISIERIRDEFIKLLMYSPKPSVGIELMRQTGLLKIFLPELLECIGVEQPEWHDQDVYNHSLKTLDLAEDSIKLAALLHDIGKARTRTEDESGVHFYGHDEVGADIAKDILIRLRFSNTEIKKIVRLIRWHMFYYPSADWRKDNEISSVLNEKGGNNGGWTDAAIRRFIRNVGEEYIEDIFKLRIADATSNTKTAFNPIEIEALESRISAIREEDMVLKVTDLDITGSDLIKLGVPKGPIMGQILNNLLEQVIDDPSINSKALLTSKVRELYKK